MKIYVAMHKEKVVGLYVTRSAADEAGIRAAGKTAYKDYVEGLSSERSDPYTLQFNLKAKTLKVNNSMYIVRTPEEES